ncbi:MAG: hypothetical protein ACE366_12535 [Bradymonadia bacterium]
MMFLKTAFFAFTLLGANSALACPGGEGETCGCGCSVCEKNNCAENGCTCDQSEEACQCEEHKKTEEGDKKPTPSK